MAAVTSGISAMRLFAYGILVGCLGLLTGCPGGGSNPTMLSIEVTPANVQLAAGTTTQLKATAIFSDTSRKDVTSEVTWKSSNNATVTISNAAGLNGLATAATVGNITASATENGVTGLTTLTVTPAVLVSIEVTPPVTNIAKGMTAQFAATGVFSDKSKQDLTAQVIWSSSNPAVAAINNMVGSNGLASAAAVGTTGISAALSGVNSASVSLTVSAATLVSIHVTPPNVSIAKGLTEQFVATGTFTDGSTQNLTSAVSWSSSNPGVATISDTAGSNGLASTAAVGSTTISASLNGITSPGAALTVTAATLVSIQTTPPSASVANGLSAQFTATGLYTDGSTKNLTTSVTWSSSNAMVGTISNAAGSNGLATSAGVGSANISATLNGITSPSAALTVTAATLVAIQVTPPSPSTARGLTEQFMATGVYTDGSIQNLTSSVTWSSSNATAATISNASGSNGLATAAATGTTYINASFGGVTSPNATLTVTAATLVSIEITPPSDSIANGLSEQFTATGLFSDGSKQDLTSSAAWSSSNTGVATFSSAPGSEGLASSAGAGSTNVSASLNGVTSAIAPLTVTMATLVAIQVTPQSPGLAKGFSEQFLATGTYTDNSTENLTSAVTWTSSSTGVATISNAAGTNGLASTSGVGATNISASLDGVTSPDAVLTVTPAVLISIQVSAPNASLANGLTEQFTATGIYTDGSGQDLTGSVTWSSSNTGVATISSAAGSSGLASAAGVGTSNISASLNGVTSPNAALTVTAATLVSIEVTPASPSIAAGGTQQFFAIGLFTDGTQVNLTSSVTWLSSNTSTATVSNSLGSSGLASSSGPGTTDISASFNAVTSPTVTLTVLPAPPAFAGVWDYNTGAGNQGVLIMDNSGNLTAFGLLNGAWYGYNGTVQISGNTASGTVTYDYPTTVGKATCESCADQDASGLQPTASLTLSVDTTAGTIVLTDSTNSQVLTFGYLPTSTSQPITTLAGAQAAWSTLVSGGESSYPNYAGWGNPYPVSAVGYGGLGNCLNGGSISADVPALGIYVLTCTQAYDAVNGVGVFNPSTTVVATGLVFMNVSGQIFGAMSDPGMFENVSYPAGLIP